MKKVRNNNIYDKAITFDNLYKIWNIVRVTCKNKREVYYFSLNLNANLMNIYNILKNRTYTPSKYRTFMIFEPKERLVMSQCIKDKIVNHFVANYYLLPLLDKSLIYENIATKKNKGTSMGMILLKKYFNKIIINEKPQEIYVLKIDISKYFYSIDHEILFNKLKDKIKDKDVINLIDIILDETNKNYISDNIKKYNELLGTNIPTYGNNRGLSIGAMSSQFLAIYYLNDIDHYVKEKLGCRYYQRYMDDILVLDTDKERLKDIWRKISKLIENLKLNVNKKSNIYKASKGFNYLGYNYKYINNKIIISFSKKTYYKIDRKLRYLKEIEYFKYLKSFSSYYGYLGSVKRIERFNFKMNTEEAYNLYKEKNKDRIVIIKDGSFYRAYNDDGKILWYIFGYKYIKENVSFGNMPYDKVIDKLKKIDMPFIITSKNDEIINYVGDSEIYVSYFNLAIKAYGKYVLENELIDRVRRVLSVNKKNYGLICKYLDEIENL